MEILLAAETTQLELYRLCDKTNKTHTTHSNTGFFFKTPAFFVTHRGVSAEGGDAKAVAFAVLHQSPGGSHLLFCNCSTRRQTPKYRALSLRLRLDKSTERVRLALAYRR